MNKKISTSIIAVAALFATTANAQTATGVAPTFRNDDERMYAGGTPCFDERTGKNICNGTSTVPGLKPVPIRAEINAKELREEGKAFRASTTQERKDLRGEIRDNRMQVEREIKDLRANATATIKNMREEMKLMIASGTPAQIKEMREEMEKRAKELRASTTAKRAEIKDEAMKKRLEIAHKQAELVNKRLDAAIERVAELANRTGKALDTLATKGVNVDASRAKLAEAKVKLDLARTKAAEVKLAMETAFASTTPKDSLNEIQSLVKEGTSIVQGAHKLVAEAISLVKPGLNKPRATTTAPATTTGTTTSTQ